MRSILFRPGEPPMVDTAFLLTADLAVECFSPRHRNITNLAKDQLSSSIPRTLRSMLPRVLHIFGVAQYDQHKAWMAGDVLRRVHPKPMLFAIVATSFS